MKLPRRSYFVYIVASISGTLYIGVTNNPPRRIFEHKQRMAAGFTMRHGCDRLVYYEAFGLVENAISREKELKGWRRSKKVTLIEVSNPSWLDLAAAWY